MSTVCFLLIMAKERNIKVKRYTSILFDPDGTLTDPKEGICGSVQYALHAFGVEEKRAEAGDRIQQARRFVKGGTGNAAAKISFH